MFFLTKTLNHLKKWINNIGPGPIIAAAFIGPGTVTVCTLAGVKFGYALLWAMLVSVFVTIILQLMVVRIGVVAQKDVSEVIKSEIKNPLFNVILIGLVLIAIFMGNAAYEAGNISGGILGLETLFGKLEWAMGNFTLNGYSLLIGFISFSLRFLKVVGFSPSAGSPLWVSSYCRMILICTSRKRPAHT